MSCHAYVSTCLPLPIMLEEIVPEESAGVGDLGDHHVLNNQDHDVQSDPFVVVEESQVATCPFFSNNACSFPLLLYFVPLP